MKYTSPWTRDAMLPQSVMVTIRERDELLLGISFLFEPAPYSKTLRYQTEGENGTFTLAPLQDTYIRLVSTLPLTPEMIKALRDDPPRARLYIFARGWYSDMASTKNYELPLCRVFHIPPDLVVGRLRGILIAARDQDLQVEHPV